MQKWPTLEIPREGRAANIKYALLGAQGQEGPAGPAGFRDWEAGGGGRCRFGWKGLHPSAPLSLSPSPWDCPRFIQGLFGAARPWSRPQARGWELRKEAQDPAFLPCWPVQPPPSPVPTLSFSVKTGSWQGQG